MAKQSFKTLLRDTIEAVQDSEVPIKAVDFDPRTKHLRVEFDREAVPAQPASLPGSSAVPDKLPPPVKFLPGTTIPDDESPVDALELVQQRPAYRMNGGG